VFLLSALVVAPYLSGPPPASGAGTARSKVALTFDDLPVHGPAPAGMSRADIARGIIAPLRAAGAPAVYGFINAKGLDGTPDPAEFLRLWRAAGFPLGNHAFSHMDLHTHTVAEFERDVLANEDTLRGLMAGQDWHWFRFPFLREGETAEKRRAAAAMLRGHGYRVAEVTLSFDDWAYHEPYARCLARGDLAAIDWLKESYLQRAAESLDLGRQTAQQIYGREINHVMLLHGGAFNVVMLPALLDLLEKRGFALVTLDEAQSDPVYAEPLDVAGGGTLLDLAATARHVTPSPRAEPPFARLTGLCK
jgi:peptidoglycan/xylan/chitin deacetylase (PgdA/CDA1 family)